MKTWFSALAALFLAFAPAQALAAKAEVYTGTFNNLAVGGYDAVAYFTESKPVKGSSDHSFDYKGAQWRFASAENLETFKADPAKYAPQYGGYCAYAVSKGQTAKGDPQVWRIVDDKLYLNFNKKFQGEWSKDIPGNIAKANENWPNVLN